MKINPIARRILRIRVVLLCTAVLAMAAAGYSLGESLTVRFGQTTAARTTDSQAPNVSLGDAWAVLGH